MARNRPGDSESKPDTGRMGFRYCHEAPDERPVVRLPECGCSGCTEFYIRHARAKRPVSQPTQPKLKPGLTDAQRKDRMLAALHAVTEGKAMPDRPTRRERDDRLAELREQSKGA